MDILNIANAVFVGSCALLVLTIVLVILNLLVKDILGE